MTTLKTTFSREAAGNLDNLLEQFQQHLRETVKHWNEDGMVEGFRQEWQRGDLKNMLSHLETADVYLVRTRAALAELERTSWSEEEEGE